MITLLQVDKSGGDIFEKDYSIVLIVNKQERYGVNIPQSIKDNLINQYRKGNFNIIDIREDGVYGYTENSKK